jgi:membrane protease YdiL (CAAX protease family)
VNDKRVSWTINDVIVALALFFLIMIIGLFAIARALAPVFPRNNALIIAFFTTYLILFLLIWYFAIVRKGASWQSLGFKSFNVFRGIGLVVVWFFLSRIVISIYVVLAQAVGLKPEEDALKRLPELFGQGTTGFIFAVIIVAIVAPVVEELVFRGFVYPAFRKRWGITAGIIASGLLFALFHSNVFVFVPIAVIGFVLAYLYEITDSLGPPIIFHALNNLLAVILIFYGRILPGG